MRYAIDGLQTSSEKGSNFISIEISTLRRSRLRWMVIQGIVVAFCLVPTAAAQAQRVMRAGAALGDATPTKRVPMRGFGYQHAEHS
ncbi:MAG: hypothetical protein MUF23_18250 [Pirellula sp.]|nr:hypothetical protein [Pirellula sp.]